MPAVLDMLTVTAGCRGVAAHQISQHDPLCINAVAKPELRLNVEQS